MSDHDPFDTFTSAGTRQGNDSADAEEAFDTYRPRREHLGDDVDFLRLGRLVPTAWLLALVDQAVDGGNFQDPAYLTIISANGATQTFWYEAGVHPVRGPFYSVAAVLPVVPVERFSLPMNVVISDAAGRLARIFIETSGSPRLLDSLA